VTAATLVNLNAWVGFEAAGPSAALAVVLLSHTFAVWCSQAFAVAGLPCASCAIAWALYAVGHGVPIGADAANLGEGTMRGLAMAAKGAAAMALASIVLSPMLGRRACLRK